MLKQGTRGNGSIRKMEGRKKVDELTPPTTALRSQDPQQQQVGGGPPVGCLLRIQVREGMLKQGTRGNGTIRKIEGRKKVDELTPPHHRPQKSGLSTAASWRRSSSGAPLHIQVRVVWLNQESRGIIINNKQTKNYFIFHPVLINIIIGDIYNINK
jgi:hypothetical protein